MPLAAATARWGHAGREPGGTEDGAVLLHQVLGVLLLARRQGVVGVLALDELLLPAEDGVDGGAGVAGRTGDAALPGIEDDAVALLHRKRALVIDPGTGAPLLVAPDPGVDGGDGVPERRAASERP